MKLYASKRFIKTEIWKFAHRYFDPISDEVSKRFPNFIFYKTHQVIGKLYLTNFDKSAVLGKFVFLKETKNTPRVVPESDL